MQELDIDLRLDEDFLFLLSFSKEFMNAFVDNPDLNNQLQQWFRKLCCEVVHGIAAKRSRNTYLARLTTCMQRGCLTEPFDQPPPSGPLPPISAIDTGEKEPPWLNDLVEEAKKQQVDGKTHPQDGRTYLATKVLENNKGACAYLAVSVVDEGASPAWVQMDNKFDEHIDKVISRLTIDPAEAHEDLDETPFQREFHEFLIDAIGAELAGYAGAGDNPQVEEMLVKFTEYIKNTSVAKEASRLKGEQLRRFLLLHLQSHLINDFE